MAGAEHGPTVSYWYDGGHTRIAPPSTSTPYTVVARSISVDLPLGISLRFILGTCAVIFRRYFKASQDACVKGGPVIVERGLDEDAKSRGSVVVGFRTSLGPELFNSPVVARVSASPAVHGVVSCVKACR